MANKQYSRLTNDYELTLSEYSSVKALEDDDSIRAQNFNFKAIGDIATVEAGRFIDVLGVVTSVGELTTLVSKKSNKEMQKRVLQLCDKSAHEIECTVWGDQAEKCDSLQVDTVVAIKGARVSDWNQKSISTSFGGAFEVDPQIPEARDLKQWRTANMGITLTQLSSDAGRGGAGGPRDNPRVWLSDIEDKHMGYGEKPDYVKCRARVAFVKKDMERPPWYTACPKCNKKVSEAQAGEWACDSCGWRGDKAEKRYILSLLAADASGDRWLTAFNDLAHLNFTPVPSSVVSKKSVQLVFKRGNVRPAAASKRSARAAAAAAASHLRRRRPCADRAAARVATTMRAARRPLATARWPATPDTPRGPSLAGPMRAG